MAAFEVGATLYGSPRRLISFEIDYPAQSPAILPFLCLRIDSKRTEHAGSVTAIVPNSFQNCHHVVLLVEDVGPLHASIIVLVYRPWLLVTVAMAEELRRGENLMHVPRFRGLQLVVVDVARSHSEVRTVDAGPAGRMCIDQLSQHRA